MNARCLQLAFVITAGILWSATPLLSAPPIKLSGTLGGVVTDAVGVAQMGATVAVYNRFDRLVQRALTDDHGLFTFDSLPSDSYSLRVQMATFVPALKHNIAVQPGIRSFLAISLTGMFSSVELVYQAPSGSALVSDDWKWVLRSSLATKPVLRYLPVSDSPHSHQTTFFSDVEGMVKISAGDGGALSAASAQGDLGTAFAFATSVLGANRLQFSGNLGYAARAGTPTAAFRTSLARSDNGAGDAELNVTVRQIMLPGHGGAGLLTGMPETGPVLRSITLGTIDRLNVTDQLRVEYGMTYENVTFVDRLNYFSPFARATYDLGAAGSVQVAYSSGDAPVDLYTSPEAGGSKANRELQSDVQSLGLFPRVSLVDGRARVQRNTNYEASYRKTIGTRTYSVGFHDEMNSNVALSVAAPASFVASGDLLPDLSSDTSIFNIGQYRSVGYMASVAQTLGDRLVATVAFGDGGSLRTDDRMLDANNAEDLRSRIHSQRRNWVTGQLSGTIPGLGTRFLTSYQWTDYRSLTPAHIYMTQALRSEAGLNMQFKQPIPRFGILPGRLEAMAELRNMMAQGYLPVTTQDGQRLLLIQSPRAVRGGISLTF